MDLHATIEVLETLAVPVVGYKTNELPAFYSAESGLPVSVRIDNPEEVLNYARAHWQLGFSSSVLVTVPPPSDSSISSSIIEETIIKAQKEADDNDIHGQDLTPYILSKISELTNGKSVKSNIDLLLNNARIAARIVCAEPEN